MRTKLLPIILLVFALAACGSSNSNSASSHGTAQQPTFSCTSASVAKFIASQTSIGSTNSHSNSTVSASFQHMQMGPHMKMTSVWSQVPGDIQRARAIVQVAQQCFAKYKDYHLALKDGYQIFAPNVPQDIYHFASIQNFLEAQTKFDVLHPSALLYNKVGSDYQLAGIMFSAPANFSEDQLNERFPLSLAPWHLHINICLPAGDYSETLFPGNSPFG